MFSAYGFYAAQGLLLGIKRLVRYVQCKASNILCCMLIALLNASCDMIHLILHLLCISCICICISCICCICICICSYCCM